MDAYSTIGSTSGIISMVSLIGYGIYKCLVHSHCKSTCCGRNFVDLKINLDEKDGDQTIRLPILSQPPPATRQT